MSRIEVIGFDVIALSDCMSGESSVMGAEIEAWAGIYHRKIREISYLKNTEN